MFQAYQWPARFLLTISVLYALVPRHFLSYFEGTTFLTTCNQCIMFCSVHVADLIMLGLATHEPYFTILREEFKPNQPRPCEVCNQYGEYVFCDCHVMNIVTMVTGHSMKECTGEVRVKQGEVSTCV